MSLNQNSDSSIFARILKLKIKKGANTQSLEQKDPKDKMARLTFVALIPTALIAALAHLLLGQEHSNLFVPRMMAIYFARSLLLILIIFLRIIWQYINLRSISNIAENYCHNIAPETWNKTCDCFFDTFEAFPDEIRLWEERNLKFIAYLVLAKDLVGFFYYFTRTAISNAIATRRISS